MDASGPAAGELEPAGDPSREDARTVGHTVEVSNEDGLDLGEAHGAAHDLVERGLPAVDHDVPSARQRQRRRAHVALPGLRDGWRSEISGQARGAQRRSEDSLRARYLPDHTLAVPALPDDVPRNVSRLMLAGFDIAVCIIEPKESDSK